MRTKHCFERMSKPRKTPQLRVFFHKETRIWFLVQLTFMFISVSWRLCKLAVKATCHSSGAKAALLACPVCGAEAPDTAIKDKRIVAAVSR